MAGRGPAPKAQHHRERDTRRRITAQETAVTDHGQRLGPDLPGGYDESVVAWYETWRTSPQAEAFEATDWQRLQMLAPLVQSYYRSPTAAAFSELRLNEERFGATLVDRQRLRMRIVREQEAAPVVALAAKREDVARRLRGAE